jgi:hypothetical protein
MKPAKRFGILASTAMLGLLYLGGTGAALAAASQPQLVNVSAAQISAAETAPLSPSSYYWHGRHYIYSWHGRYYNHRSWRNKQWYYYG